VGLLSLYTVPGAYVLGPHPGARNDKCAVKYDQFVMDIHEGVLYGDVEWSYYGDNGETKTETGCWLLCDGGYHKWRSVSLCASSHLLLP
jgi:hypothetical protein